MNKRHWNPPALRFQWLHEKFMLAVARELCELNVPKESSALLRWANYVEPCTRLSALSPDTTVKLQLRDASEHFSQATAIAGRSKQFHDCEFIKWRKMHWKSLIENCKIDFIHSSQPTWTFCIILVHKAHFAYIRAFSKLPRPRNKRRRENFPFFVITFYHSISPHKSLFLSPPFSPAVDREASDRAMKT